MSKAMRLLRLVCHVRCSVLHVAQCHVNGHAIAVPCVMNTAHRNHAEQSVGQLPRVTRYWSVCFLKPGCQACHATQLHELGRRRCWWVVRGSPPRSRSLANIQPPSCFLPLRPARVVMAQRACADPEKCNGDSLSIVQRTEPAEVKRSDELFRGEQIWAHLSRHPYVLGVVETMQRPCFDRVDHARLEIHQDRTRNVVLVISLPHSDTLKMWMVRWAGLWAGAEPIRSARGGKASTAQPTW